MDATDENTKELFPAYLNNQSYLVANPRGETLLTSPVISSDQNMLNIHTRGTLDKQGNLACVSCHMAHASDEIKLQVKGGCGKCHTGDPSGIPGNPGLPSIPGLPGGG